MRSLDLNVDIGEGFPHDLELLRVASSANVCCGVHAGSPELTRETVARCLEAGVRVGAHPGYPDRAGMGRLPVKNPENLALLHSLKSQIDLVPEATYIKPHGAWYNRLVSHSRGADVALLKAAGKPVMLLAGSPLAQISEGFADRGYGPEGRLIPRGEPGAILETFEAVLAQALRLAERVDSICLHGDTPGCVEFAERLRVGLESAGYAIRA